MALRPVSPVQLVTRALRSVWPVYQTSVWHADRFRDAGTTFGTYRAAAFAAGTDNARWVRPGMPHLRALEWHEHTFGNFIDGTTLGQRALRCANSCVDDRPSPRPTSVEPSDIVGDIVYCHCFNLGHGGELVKWFWKHEVDAMWFGIDENSTIFSGKQRTLVQIWVSRQIFNSGVPIGEPSTQGWLGYSGPTLDALNLDILTKNITQPYVWPADPP